MCKQTVSPLKCLALSAYLLLCACGGSGDGTSDANGDASLDVNGVEIDANDLNETEVGSVEPVNGQTILASAPWQSNAVIVMGIYDSNGVTPLIHSETPGSAVTGEIDLLAWHWKSLAVNQINCVDGFSVTKLTDRSSAGLLQAQFVGRSFPLGRLKVRRLGDGMPLEYLTLEFSNIEVTMIESGGNAVDEQLVDVINFKFDALTFTYQPVTETGTAGSPITASGADFSFTC